jgi:trehalose 6-phosphate phosphatase
MPKSRDAGQGPLPHLLAHWKQVRPRIQAARAIVIFLDFDGTLVDLAPRPEMVKMRTLTREIITRLARHDKARLVIISGRRLHDLRARVGIGHIRYLGLYGSEQGPTVRLSRTTEDALRRARMLMTKVLSRNPEIWVENKQLSFVIHWRDAKPAVWKAARSRLRNVLAPFNAELRMIHNLRDSEVIPKDIGSKGGAVVKELARETSRGQLGFYFGDDLSDESAFSVLPRGITVLTGKPRRTKAKFYLRNPREVTQTLARMEVALR